MNILIVGLMILFSAQTVFAQDISYECPEHIAFKFSGADWETISASDNRVKAKKVQANYMFCEVNNGVYVGLVRKPVPAEHTCKVSGKKQFDCVKSPIRFTTFNLEPVENTGPDGCSGKSTFFVKTEPPTKGVEIQAWASGRSPDVYYTDDKGEINGEYEIVHNFDPNAKNNAQSDQCIMSENPAKKTCRYARKPSACNR